MFPLLIFQPSTSANFLVPNATALYSVSIEVQADGDESGDPIFGSGKITVTSRQDHRLIQTFRMPNLVIFRDHLSRSIGPKDKSLSPYGDTYSLVFQDFDFDGHQDLAVCRDLDGSYGAPSYSVYRWNPKALKFSIDPLLTKLSSAHLGLICTDPQQRVIMTFDKSGAAWHKTSSYRWRNGHLSLFMEEVEDATGTEEVITTKTKVGSKWQVKVRRRPLQP